VSESGTYPASFFEGSAFGVVEATPQQPPPAAVSDGRPGSSSDQPQEAPEIPQFFEGSAFGVVQQRPMPKVKCHFTSAIKRHSQSSGSVLVVLFNAHRNDDATRVRNFLATVSTKQDHVFCTWGRIGMRGIAH